MIRVFLFFMFMVSFHVFGNCRFDISITSNTTSYSDEEVTDLFSNLLNSKVRSMYDFSESILKMDDPACSLAKDLRFELSFFERFTDDFKTRIQFEWENSSFMANNSFALDIFPDGRVEAVKEIEILILRDILNPFISLDFLYDGLKKRETGFNLPKSTQDWFVSHLFEQLSVNHQTYILRMRKRDSFLSETQLTISGIDVDSDQNTIFSLDDEMRVVELGESIEGLMEAHQRIPQKFKDFLKGKIRSFAFERCDEGCVRGDNIILGVYRNSSKSISIYTDYAEMSGKRKLETNLSSRHILQTVVHEYAHAIEYALPDSVRNKYFQINWSKSIMNWIGGYKRRNDVPAVRDYGETNEHEDFATAFELYVLDREKLARNFFNRYDFFRMLERCIDRDIAKCMEGHNFR